MHQRHSPPAQAPQSVSASASMLSAHTRREWPIDYSQLMGPARERWLTRDMNGRRNGTDTVTTMSSPSTTHDSSCASFSAAARRPTAHGSDAPPVRRRRRQCRGIGSAPRTRPAEQRTSDRRDGRYQCGRERDQHHAGHRSRPFIGLHQPRAIGSHGRWSPRLNSLRHRVFLSSLFHRIRGKLRRGA